MVDSTCAFIFSPTRMPAAFQLLCELICLVAPLCASELEELARRVKNGEIDGHCYYSEGCGCFYGTIGLMHGESKAMLYNDGDRYRDQLIGDADTMTNESGITALEEQVYPIYEGQTPDSNDRSAWLHGLIFSEIARRAAE